MQSITYPNIIFIKNQNLSFLGSSITTESNLILLHPSDPLIQHYTVMTKKLFKEINLIKEMLWIGRIKSTKIIRIYFSQPFQYPISTCCKVPVFIEIENDTNGSIICSKCSKESVHFVRAGLDQISEQQLFRKTRKEMKIQKEQLRGLLTSQKFRDRKLRNNFMGENLCKEGDLIVEITSTPAQNFESYKSQEPLTQSIKELRGIINDIFM